LSHNFARLFISLRQLYNWPWTKICFPYYVAYKKK